MARAQIVCAGQIIRVSRDAYKDPRFFPDVDQRKGKTTHRCLSGDISVRSVSHASVVHGSILCCPIKAELEDGTARIIGVMSVRDEKDRGGFEQEEEKLLKVFCAQVTAALCSVMLAHTLQSGRCGHHERASLLQNHGAVRK